MEVSLGFDSAGMRELLKLMEVDAVNEALHRELEQLIDLKYEVIALTEPEQLNENWLHDKFKNVGKRIRAAIAAFKEDPNAPEMRSLSDEIISINDEIINSFSSIPTGKIRAVYYSDNYDDIKRVYKSGLAPEDISNVKTKAAKFADSGNKQIRYSDNFQFLLFEPGSNFAKMGAYSGAPSFLGGTTFRYAVVFNAPKSMWITPAADMATALSQFKPSDTNDNAVGILNFKKGSSYKKAIMYPVLNQEVLQKEYGAELPDGVSFSNAVPGQPIVSNGSSNNTTSNAAPAAAPAAPVTPKVEITDFKAATAALKQIKKDVEDGKIMIDAKSLKDIETLKTHIEDLIKTAKEKIAGSVKQSNWIDLNNAVKGDLTDKKNLSKVKSTYNKLKVYVEHWLQHGGSKTKNDMIEVKKGVNDIIVSGKTTLDPTFRTTLDDMATDFKTYDTSK